MTAAQGGDEKALGSLSEKAQAYLTEAQSYYASSTAYAQIFASVTAALEDIAGGIEQGPTVDEIIAANTGKSAQLQEVTIAALNALEAASRELQAQAETEAQRRLTELTTEMEAQTQTVVAELLAQQVADSNGFDLTVAQFNSLKAALTTLSKEEITQLSGQFGTLRAGLETLKIALGQALTDTATQDRELNRLLQTSITLSGQGVQTATAKSILDSIAAGKADTATITALLNQSLSSGQIHTDNLKLLLSTHIDVSKLSASQIVAKTAELLQNGTITAGQITETLRWMSTTGQLADAQNLGKMLAQLQTGFSTNQTMIGLLQTQVSQGGTGAAAAQEMIQRLNTANAANTEIQRILGLMRSGDLTFSADVAKRLHDQYTILGNNGVAANQNANDLVRNILGGTGATTGAVQSGTGTTVNALGVNFTNLLKGYNEVSNQNAALIGARIDSSIWLSGSHQTGILKQAIWDTTIHLRDGILSAINGSIHGALSVVLSGIAGAVNAQGNRLDATFWLALNNQNSVLSGAIWGSASQIVAAINGIPTRAGGGYTAPGWALVGEEGPELINFSAPGRVYTAAETQAMLTPAGASPSTNGEETEAVVVELKALIRLQSSANQQLIKKLDAVEARLSGIESKARLEAAA